MWKRVLPITKIKKGSVVVLYGAGMYGREFWNQNAFLEWCQIPAVIDKRASEISDFPCPVYPIDKLEQIGNYDYILIAIADKEGRKSVAQYLQDLGVKKDKIITDIDYFLEHNQTVDVVETNNSAEDKLTIGFHPTGGLGDYIIELCVYQEIARMAPDSVIDVIGLNADFGESVYRGQPNLRRIYKGEGTDEIISKYDVFIEVRFEIKISAYNREKTVCLAPTLAEALDKHIKYNEKYYVGLPFFQYTNAVLLNRAKLMGWNRYTIYRCSGAFNVADRYSAVCLDEEFEEAYKNLGLGDSYITFNYGANRDYGIQPKMWLFEYHEELNQMLKKRFPKIKLVQIGSRDAKRVPGADRYIMGQNLEVTKYVLKNSLFHFDCEGGLVHLASQLGTKCFVVFGPTPIWFLGYKNNTNISPKVCGECKSTHLNWFTECIKYDKPECMYSITPDYVFSFMEDYLNNMEDRNKENC